MKKHNYPIEVVRAIEKWYLYNYDGISEDEVQRLSPEEVLAAYLEWEGIIGYTNTIIAIMKDKAK